MNRVGTNLLIAGSIQADLLASALAQIFMINGDDIFHSDVLDNGDKEASGDAYSPYYEALGQRNVILLHRYAELGDVRWWSPSTR